MFLVPDLQNCYSHAPWISGFNTSDMHAPSYNIHTIQHNQAEYATGNENKRKSLS